MPQYQWDIEADLVIAGFGAAGAAAAITAAKTGAKVLLVEKQERERHTPNIRMSGGLVMTFNDADKAETYLARCAGPMVGNAEIRALAERLTTLRAWLDAHCGGTPFTLVNGAEHPEFEGAEACEVFQQGVPRFKQDPQAGNGASLFASLRETVEAGSTEILWGAPARKLLRDADGRICGILAGKPGQEQHIRAREGVILTTGGFEYDEAAKLSYLRAYPMYFYGNPGNTGDGLRMAQEVGADLWHMPQIVGRAVGHFQLDDGSWQTFFIAIDPPGYVILDGDGKRFANEHDQAMNKHDFYYHLVHFDTQRGIHPRMPCYWIFDEKRRLKAPATLINVGACSVGLYEWSADNSKEIERGWIAKGDTPAAAAKAAGLDAAEAVTESIRTYNEACATGIDPFGRPVESLVPIDTGPFYCVKLWPGGPNTTGGPRRNAQGKVLDVRGEPIPGLFSAGELGQVSGMMYPADGANLGEALCYGQIAAEAALSRFRSV
ncbi:FAD-binding protein [Chelativorans sp. Marseille-P2723]|uniref:FAD-binding protein n=1 Tax=Chelativorans sp. Marseille-P2723 TaxID=2709133 RepID=UPI00156E3FA1|nr:FAD-binding protein [Chelativorans sp. Marseille-P2723]